MLTHSSRSGGGPSSSAQCAASAWSLGPELRQWSSLIRSPAVLFERYPQMHSQFTGCPGDSVNCIVSWNTSFFFFLALNQLDWLLWFAARSPYVDLLTKRTLESSHLTPAVPVSVTWSHYGEAGSSLFKPRFWSTRL